jgi:hypothetical protein
MITRTVTHFVEFKRPFLLPGIGRLQPPGRYRVESDEEQIDSHTVTAFRRIATRFYAAPENSTPGVQEEVLITPEELTAALARDARVVFGRPYDRGVGLDS